MALIIKKIAVGPLCTNCYVASCEYTGNTFIIDPGDSPKVIANYARRNEFVPKAIILTHGHPDHVGAVRNLRSELRIPVYIHQGDKEMLEIVSREIANKYLADGEILDLGREKLTVIHTPGHTQGSICMRGNGILFSGDTLFKEGVGRTDLPGGSFSQLEDSLKNKLFILPPDTVVYPGHGDETTIGQEKY